MFGTLDAARILEILNNNGVNIGLKKAFFIAHTIMDLHSDRVIQVENVAYDRGYAEGKKVQIADGVSEMELARLRRIEEQAIQQGRSLVGKIVGKHGRDRKIACIKALREVTILGLKDAKDIVDQYIRDLDAADGMGSLDHSNDDSFF